MPNLGYMSVYEHRPWFQQVLGREVGWLAAQRPSIGYFTPQDRLEEPADALRLGRGPHTPRNSRRDLMILKLLTPPRAPRTPFFTEPKQSHELRADRFGHRKGRMLPRRDPW